MKIPSKMSPNVEMDLDWTPSELVARVMKIAKEENTSISEETFRELDDALKVEPQLAVFLGAPQGATGTVKDALAVFKDCADLGKLVFDKVGKYLGPIGAMASLVKDLISLAEPKKEDPVMKELKEVEHQIAKLSDKMSWQFDDLKSFVAEADFFGKYALSTTTLLKYMRDTLDTPTKTSKAEFEKVYNSTDPKKLVYDMLSMLELDKTNPLKWAMKADGLMSTPTFDKWRGILDSVLTQALILEKYASGLLLNGDNDKVDRVVKQILRFKELEKQWDAEYKKSDAFWPNGVKTFMEKIQEDDDYEGHEKKANKIWEGIKSIHTNDCFYLVVYGDHISKWTVADSSRVIWTFRGGYHVVVYRTREYKWSDAYAVDSVRKLTKDYFRAHYGWWFDHWAIVRAWFTQDRINGFSKQYPGNKMFLAVAQSRDNIAIRYTEQGRRNDYGPGDYSFQGELNCFDGVTSTRKKLFFLVAV